MSGALALTLVAATRYTSFCRQYRNDTLSMLMMGTDSAPFLAAIT